MREFALFLTSGLKGNNEFEMRCEKMDLKEGSPDLTRKREGIDRVLIGL